MAHSTLTHQCSRAVYIATDIVALLLLFSATLKLFGYAVDPTSPIASWQDHPSIILSISAIESSAALWLFSRQRWGLAIRATIVLFVAFLLVATLDLINRRASCGCFGHVRVPPAVTLFLDSTVLVTLLLANRTQIPIVQMTPRTPLRSWGIGIAALVCSSGLLVATLIHPRYTHILDLRASVVVLEPDDWIGQPFPLLPYVKGSSVLVTGHWIIVIYHHDCSECQQAVSRYVALAGPTHRTAFIEMPPYDTSNTIAISVSADCFYGRLDDSKEWFATTPAIIDLQNGVVQGNGEKSPRP